MERAAMVLIEGGQWWATSVRCAMRRWPLMVLLVFRTRLLGLFWDRSAAHLKALDELDALHASDRYDLMRGMCRATEERRGPERGWGRSHGEGG